MKVTELLEGKFRGHGYDLGNYPTSRDRGLGALYNVVLPELSRIFKLPMSSFKLQSDYGFGWSNNTKFKRAYSTERFLLKVILRRKNLDVDLIFKLLPKALESQLKKTLVDVEVTVLEMKPEAQANFGTEKLQPPEILIGVKTKYPQEWRELDKKRYNITW